MSAIDVTLEMARREGAAAERARLLLGAKERVAWELENISNAYQLRNTASCREFAEHILHTIFDEGRTS